MFFRKRHKNIQKKVSVCGGSLTFSDKRRKRRKKAAGLLKSPAALPYVWLCGCVVVDAPCGGVSGRPDGGWPSGREFKSPRLTARAGGPQRKMYLARKRRVRRYMMGLMERARPAASERTVQEMTPSEMPSAML